ncbi:phage holin family protein [Paenibacillus massiliensis]|uniref:phage holin family protein n=1 Tax=Paenibacillus massiliensis TaxID=225917 RepID=UPI000403EA31|nr:phage holin family protein [Paenibacillus massiliensis]
METVGKYILMGCSWAAAYFFGGWSGILGVLLAFVVLDYVSGLVAAGVTGELQSRKGLYGIARKVFIFAMVAVGHLVDGVLGDGHMFRDAIIYFYMANELLSWIENAGKIGLPVPEQIKQAVAILKGKSGIDKGDDKVA